MDIQTKYVLNQLSNNLLATIAQITLLSSQTSNLWGEVFELYETSSVASVTKSKLNETQK